MKNGRGLWVVLVGLVLLAGCGEKAVQSAAPEKPVAVVPPAKPRPNFVIEDDGGYGYEQAISQDEQDKGQAAAKIAVFYYLGQRDKLHQVMIKVGTSRTVAECTIPCDYAKSYSFLGDRFVDKQILKITPEALLQAVYQDVSNGYLKPYTGRQQGKDVQFWVDGDARRLIVSAAK